MRMRKSDIYRDSNTQQSKDIESDHKVGKATTMWRAKKKILKSFFKKIINYKVHKKLFLIRFSPTAL